MKKVKIEIQNTGLNIQDDTSEWFMFWLNSIDRNEALQVNQTMTSLIEQGDIWFINDDTINDGEGFLLNLIFDSEEAIESWKPIQHVFEQMFVVAGEEPNIVIEDMTFEEFATFAANNEETKFSGLPEDF